MTDPEEVLAEAWRHLADACVQAVHAHHHLISQLSRVGLLPSPAATALTANTDQLEATAAQIRRQHQPNQRSPGTSPPH
jgi:uncharacterized membrane protein YccC